MLLLVSNKDMTGENEWEQTDKAQGKIISKNHSKSGKDYKNLRNATYGIVKAKERQAVRNKADRHSVERCVSQQRGNAFVQVPSNIDECGLCRLCNRPLMHDVQTAQFGAGNRDVEASIYF